MQDPPRPTGRSDQIPATCPYGHELGPPLNGVYRVLVGHQPCNCEYGHRTYQCLACLRLPDKRRVVGYFPPYPRPHRPAA